MTKVWIEEKPAVLTKHTVWVVKNEGDEWGKLRDDVYHDRFFEANRACVIVTERGGNYWSHWMQAREYLGANHVHVVGTHTVVRLFSRDDEPHWLREIEQLAIDSVKAVKDD